MSTQDNETAAEAKRGHVVVMKARYQIVTAKIPPDANVTDTMVHIADFEPPAGFRLHTAIPLKPSALVGAPLKALMIFERID
jgi:hypothetical protein